MSRTGAARAAVAFAPDSFTHGTSQQRMGWFQRGLESGDMRACNTFGKSDAN